MARRQELRRALIAELEVGELLASHSVVKYARWFMGDDAKVALVANEIRWFADRGRTQLEAVGLISSLPTIPQKLDKITDAQLVDAFSRINETVGTKLVFPVVGGVLAGKTSGLTEKQIAALSMVYWQAHLLAQNADAMKEFLVMTFTVVIGPHRVVQPQC
jgi:hypothetical protein